jgi:hypothetical protein
MDHIYYRTTNQKEKEYLEKQAEKRLLMIKYKKIKIKLDQGTINFHPILVYINSTCQD